MKILVVGSGGREHALSWGIAKSPLCEKLYAAPGNPGIAAVAECMNVAVDNIAGLVALAKEKKIDLVVVGPEIPLSLGLVDALRAENILAFGPTQAAAELEASKGFMKDVVSRAGVPTAAYQRFTDVESARAYVHKMGAPIVVKADGLAAGKGVTVAQTVEEAIAAIDDAMVRGVFGASGAEVVVEEFMQGEEVSFFALSDGNMALPFAAAQDHKAVYDGDKGPNTGGMGAYSPAPMIDAAMQQRIMDEVINPTVKAMKEMERPFQGVLFAGLMMTKTGPRLIEFNARFGDPETEVMIPRLKSDLLTVLHAAARGRLDEIKLEWHADAALCVVMAAEGYPGSYKKGTVIRGLDKANQAAGGTLFHAGTSRNDAGDIIATGGRVLAVTAMGRDVAAAQRAAYAAVDCIEWPEGFCRRDIGWRAVGRG